MATNYSVQFDQATKRYIFKIPCKDSYYYIPVHEEYGLIELLEWLTRRSETFFTALGEPLLINNSGNVSCSHPDPWLNKDFILGCTYICDCEDLARLVSATLKEFIDGRYAKTNSRS